ncbi:MAG TPA: hypothetical protein VFW93_12990 [Aquabacterium sp.]|uniref:hypothetical protein n=1 Tax=Aquabacterium sp. TaxID=1872578 RepID=UPI002E337CBB|nr:hypothetical protein [Aquabacterium sp.]HEX5357129.1 hypothetical protein [Aquabacterium sp.]
MTRTFMHRRHILQAIAASSLIGAMACAPTWAHDDAYLDTVKAPHGGQLRMAGPVHLELVLSKTPVEAKDKPIEVYVTDHAGKTQATAGASGTITILYGKTKVTATLKPDGDNKLIAQASYASTPDIKAIVSVTMAGQPAQQARFTPMRP